MFYDCPMDISYQKLIEGAVEKLNNFVFEVLAKKKKPKNKQTKRMMKGHGCPHHDCTWNLSKSMRSLLV